MISFSCTGDEFYSRFSQMLLSENDSIKVLMVGDVVGRGGRKALKKVIPLLKENTHFDFITVNGENLAGGFGITQKIYVEIKSLGIHAITMGNHWKDKADVHNIKQNHTDLVLPQNLIGVSGVETIPSFYLEKRNKTIHVINLMGLFAMREEYNNPFEFLVKEKNNLQDKVQSGLHIVIADIHAEASSEKQAIAWFYDGILAGLIGTHTHTPTSDERLTDKGTAFLTDVGMTGAYDSVIGMDKDRVIKLFTTPKERQAHQVAENDLWFCAFLLEICPKKNKTLACHRLQCRLGAEKDYWSCNSVVH